MHVFTYAARVLTPLRCLTRASEQGKQRKPTSQEAKTELDLKAVVARLAEVVLLHVRPEGEQ